MSYKIGNILIYTCFGGDRRIVRVTDTGTKNDRPLFDGVIVAGPNKGMSIWGYDSQIIAVLPEEQWGGNYD